MAAEGEAGLGFPYTCPHEGDMDQHIRRIGIEVMGDLHVPPRALSIAGPERNPHHREMAAGIMRIAIDRKPRMMEVLALILQRTR